MCDIRVDNHNLCSGKVKLLSKMFLFVCAGMKA